MEINDYNGAFVPDDDVYAPTPPMTILHISSEYVSGKNVLHVEANAATEMSFEMHLKPGDDYDRAIADLCALAPVLLRLDGDLMESADDGGRTKPRRHDLLAVEAFVNRWRSRIKNCNVAAGAFARLVR